MTILGALVDPYNTIKDLGPFGIYLYKLLERKEILERIKKALGEIRQLKARINNLIDGLLRNPDLHRVKVLYDELFSIGDLDGKIKDANGNTTV